MISEEFRRFPEEFCFSEGFGSGPIIIAIIIIIIIIIIIMLLLLLLLLFLLIIIIIIIIIRFAVLLYKKVSLN